MYPCWRHLFENNNKKCENSTVVETVIYIDSWNPVFCVVGKAEGIREGVASSSWGLQERLQTSHWRWSSKGDRTPGLLWEVFSEWRHRDRQYLVLNFVGILSIWKYLNHKALPKNRMRPGNICYLSVTRMEMENKCLAAFTAIQPSNFMYVNLTVIQEKFLYFFKILFLR